MNEVERLWLRTLQTVVDKAAHEVKDSLNGVSLNLEVVRSRSRKEGVAASEVSGFASAAATQLETLSERTEALLFLARPQRKGSPVDVAQTLHHLAMLLVPAARADRVHLTVEGAGGASPTSASAEAVRLALAGGLLALVEHGHSGHCRLDAGPDTVVRFSHESAETSLHSLIAAAVVEHNIIIETGTRGAKAGDLLVVFPGS